MGCLQMGLRDSEAEIPVIDRTGVGGQDQDPPGSSHRAAVVADLYREVADRAAVQVDPFASEEANQSIPIHDHRGGHRQRRAQDQHDTSLDRAIARTSKLLPPRLQPQRRSPDTPRLRYPPPLRSPRPG